MKFKSIEDAIENYNFTASDLLDNEEEDDFEYNDTGYKLEEYAIDHDIDLDERKREHIEFLMDEGEITITEST